MYAVFRCPNFYEPCRLKESYFTGSNKSDVDPHWFQCGSGSSILSQRGSGPSPDLNGGTVRYLIPKIVNYYSWNRFWFLTKNCNSVIPRLHDGRQSYRRLQSSKENFQHFNHCADQPYTLSWPMVISSGVNELFVAVWWKGLRSINLGGSSGEEIHG